MSKDVEVKIYIEKIDKLVHNELNPRVIRGKKHKELMESLKQFPEMKLLREIVVDEDLMILAGDKRAWALKELGYTDVTIKQVFNLTNKQKQEFIAKDNVHSGEWDTDIIANHWDADLLQEWGVPDFKLGNIENEQNNDSGKKDPKFIECPECGHEFEQ